MLNTEQSSDLELRIGGGLMLKSANNLLTVICVKKPNVLHYPVQAKNQNFNPYMQQDEASD